jgi:hypothetical protein
MIILGCCDATVTDQACNEYKDRLVQMTRTPLAEVVEGVDKMAFQRYVPGGVTMKIAEVQGALTSLGFFPGGRVDGICGYRTQSAIRLFQEYVRSVEKRECTPDGRFGPQTEQHLTRWLGEHKAPVWSAVIDRWRANSLTGTEYAAWLTLLEQVKADSMRNPNRVLQMVNAFGKPTDTRTVAHWDFSPDQVHLIGTRQNHFSGKFDDVFVLLIKGLVFKFQGSTDPGASTNPLGTPWLVPGQHNYHFGWHRRIYLALRPEGAGVLVARAPHGQRLDEAMLAAGRLEANASINVHWGGKGMRADVKNWSEGCQVINGTAYLNATDELITCAAFAGTNQTELNGNLSKTRGAYNVLLDLVTALGSDLPGNSLTYTLLAEQDLDRAPALKQGLADAAARVAKMCA